MGSSTYFVPWGLYSCHPIHLTLTFSPQIHILCSGIYPGVLTPGDLGGLPSHIPTLPSLLGERNYSSLLLGKIKIDLKLMTKSIGSSFQANGTWESEQRGRAFLQGAVSNNIWGWVSSTYHGYIFHDCDDQDGNLVHSDTCVRMSCKRTTKSCK